MPEETDTQETSKGPFTYLELDRIKNDALRSIAEKSCINLVDLIASHEGDILTCLQSCEEPTATLSHSIKLDYAKRNQTDKLTFSLKHSDEITTKMDDPAQPEFPSMSKEKNSNEPKKADAVDIESEVKALPAPVLAIEDATFEVVEENQDDSDK